jgi:hypothetical protein
MRPRNRLGARPRLVSRSRARHCNPHWEHFDTHNARPLGGIDLLRTLYVYAAAGRQRSAPVAAILKMLRAADWSRCED